MESEHWVGKVAQKALIEKDGKILFVRDSREERPGIMWDLPGGRLHRGENPPDGLAREIMEEMGVEVEIGEILYANQFVMVHGNQPHLMLVYDAVLKNPEKEFTLDPNEIAEARWLGPRDITPAQMYDSYREIVTARFKSCSDDGVY